MGLNIQKELKELKDKYSITNSTIAKLLGCSRTSIYTYEAGGEPSRVHNSLIKLISIDQQYIADLALINRDLLSDTELKQILTSEQLHMLKHIK